MSTPAPSTAFSEAIRLLLELHGLYARGLDEGPEADAVRDALDGPWYAMTEDEQRRIRQLSADLYTIGERHEDPLPSREIVAQFEATRAREEWLGLLSLLQEHAGLAAPAQRGYLRGIAWAALGAPAAGVLFLEDGFRALAGRQAPAAPSPSDRPARGGQRRPFPRLGPIEREAA